MGMLSVKCRDSSDGVEIANIRIPVYPYYLELGLVMCSNDICFCEHLALPVAH